MPERSMLRTAAEARLPRVPVSLTGLTTEEMRTLVHELQVHQIELEMQNDELRRTHAALDAARERYFDLYDLAPVSYLTLDEHGLILEANLTAATLLGMTRSALVKQPFSRFIVAADQDLYYLTRKQLVATHQPQCAELRMVKMDASVFWARLESTIARDLGVALVSRIVLSDVTKDRKLEESCLMKNRVFDASMTANGIADPDGIITEANETFVRIWGFACKEEVIGHRVPEFFTEQSEAEAILATLASPVGTGYWQGEFNAKRKDGSAFMARGLASVVRDAQGKLVGFQSSVVDITETRLIENALRQSEQRYRNLHESMRDAFVTADMKGRITESNRAFQELLGYTQEELRHLTYNDLTPPKWHALERRLVDEQILPLGASDTYEKEYLRKDGSALPVEMRVFLLRDATGQPSAMWAIVRDITERKQAEEIARLHSLVLANMAEGVIMVRMADGMIVYVNPKFEAMFGYAPDELLGRSVAILNASSTQSAEEVAAEITKVVVGSGSWNGEVENVRKDGSVFYSYAHVAPFDHGTYGRVAVTVQVDLSKLKYAQEALRKSEELLNAIQHLSKVGGWLWDIQHQSMFWTAETYRIHGYAPDEVGTAMDEHIVKSLGLCDEADRPAILAAFLRCVEFGEAYDIEYAFTSATGRRLWVRTSAHAVWEGSRIVQVVGNIIDVTERKQAEQALREWSATLEQRVVERTLELKDSEARFRQLAEATFEGIAISENGILLDANRRLAEFHGYEPAEMLGRPLTDFVAPESHATLVEKNRDGNDSIYEFLALRKDGSVFPAEVHGRKGVWMGRPTRISALRDLSAAKQAAATLRAKQAELAHAQHLALVSEVSAGIIHQLGQPLSAIGANLSAMVKLKAAELEHCGALAIIHDVEADVARMRDIVVHLRALANPMQPTRVVSDFNTIVAGVLPLLRQKAENRRFRMVVELGEDLPAVHADTVQMSQVILNLVRNAFDAAHECTAKRRSVEVTTRAHGESAVELRVRDSGCGISPETMSRLFNPFFSTKPDGLGVGLRLSQTIVQAHGGAIEGFNNPDGLGATFRIVLPAIPPDKILPAPSHFA